MGNDPDLPAEEPSTRTTDAATATPRADGRRALTAPARRQAVRLAKRGRWSQLSAPL